MTKHNNNIADLSGLLAAASESTNAPQPFTLPGGSIVFLRVITGKERDEMEATIAKRKNTQGGTESRGLRMVLLALSVCTEDGTRLLVDKAAQEQFAEVVSGVCMNDLFVRAMEINGIGEDDKEPTNFSKDAPS